MFSAMDGRREQNVACHACSSARHCHCSQISNISAAITIRWCPTICREERTTVDATCTHLRPTIILDVVWQSTKSVAPSASPSIHFDRKWGLTLCNYDRTVARCALQTTCSHTPFAKSNSREESFHCVSRFWPQKLHKIKLLSLFLAWPLTLMLTVVDH